MFTENVLHRIFIITYRYNVKTVFYNQIFFLSSIALRIRKYLSDSFSDDVTVSSRMFGYVSMFLQ